MNIWFSVILQKTNSFAHFEVHLGKSYIAQKMIQCKIISTFVRSLQCWLYPARLKPIVLLDEFGRICLLCGSANTLIVKVDASFKTSPLRFTKKAFFSRSRRTFLPETEAEANQELSSPGCWAVPQRRRRRFARPAQPLGAEVTPSQRPGVTPRCFPRRGPQPPGQPQPRPQRQGRTRHRPRRGSSRPGGGITASPLPPHPVQKVLWKFRLVRYNNFFKSQLLARIQCFIRFDTKATHKSFWPKKYQPQPTFHFFCCCINYQEIQKTVKANMA